MLIVVGRVSHIGSYRRLVCEHASPLIVAIGDATFVDASPSLDFIGDADCYPSASPMTFATQAQKFKLTHHTTQAEDLQHSIYTSIYTSQITSSSQLHPVQHSTSHNMHPV